VQQILLWFHRRVTKLAGGMPTFRVGADGEVGHNFTERRLNVTVGHMANEADKFGRKGVHQDVVGIKPNLFRRGVRGDGGT